MTDDKKLTGKEADAILEEARKRFKAAREAEQKMRENALDDLRFLSGEQWDEAAKNARRNRPMLTINRLPQYVRQVVNEQRKTRPAIEVVPADAKASKPTADVVQGMVRHIERMSRARVAYDTAFEYAVSCGVGHFRVSTKYVDADSFDQELVIQTIDNPLTVYRDPYSKEADHSDDNFTFVSEFVEPEVFEAKYGFAPTPFEDAGEGDEVQQWYEKELVRVCEYWRVTAAQDEVHALSDGTKLRGPLTKQQRDELAGMGLSVQNSRSTERRVVEQYIVTWDTVIKKKAWAGKYIPILTTVGGSVNIDGERVITSLIRDAKDPAKMYNYMVSASVESIALQPKVPYVGAHGAFAGHEQEWARANVDNQAYLEYVPVPGEPKPERQMPAPYSQAYQQERMAAAEDIKATLGMYDASLGARSNETSGVAIRARQQEGDTGTFHFIDNHARSIEQCGRILIDLMPHIYDRARTVRIVGPTEQEDVVMINQTFIDPQSGQEVNHDLQLGRYEVAVRVGPSFESKRQEMVQAMLEISAKAPQILAVTGDLVMKNMDWPESEEISKRLFMLLPPQLQGKPQQQQPNPLAEAEKIKQSSQMQIKQMEFQLEMKSAMLDFQKELQLQRERLASAERIAAMNNAAKTNVELATSAERFALQRHLQENENLRKAADVTIEAMHAAHTDHQHAQDLTHEQDMQEQDMQHQRRMAMMAPAPQEKQ